MKFALFAVLLAVAGINALPEPEVAPTQGYFIDDWILDGIQRVSALIRLLGWDPVNIASRDFKRVVVPGLLELEGFVENLRFTGLSNIAINNLYYNILIGRLDLDLALPELAASVENSSVDAVIGDLNINLGTLSGSLVITNVRIVGNILFIVQIGNISVYNINLDFSVQEIKADLKVIGDEDYSERVNLFLNQSVPAFLQQFRGEINTLLGEAVRWIVNVGWPRSIY